MLGRIIIFFFFYCASLSESEMQEYNLAVTTLINLQALVFNYQGLLTLKVAFFKQGDVLQETVNKTQNIIIYQF